jgi:hypothetical protein
MTLKVIGGLFILLLLGRMVCAPATDRGRFHQQEVVVQAVEPGPRLVLDDDVRVRLLGVTVGRREEDRASTVAWLRERAEGQNVLLYLDKAPHRGRDGDLLAYVYQDDELLNGGLIEAGLAYADRRFDYVYAGTFTGLEQAAMRKRLGVWEAFPNVPDEAMPAWRVRWLAELRKPSWEQGDWRPGAP